MSPDVAASIRARLLNQAKGRAEEFELTLTRFAAQRLLYRLGASAARHRCVLKGAAMLSVWLPNPYRATRDVDVLASGPADEEAVRSLVAEICAVPCPDDGLRFDLSDLTIETIRPEEEYAGKRARFRAFLGKARIAVQLDIGVGDAVAIEPITVQESSFQANRLLTLRTRNSSAYKGIYALLMRDGGRDFRTGEPIEAQTFFDDKIDIHHVFPERWCRAEGIEAGVFNSVINKMALSARTNRQIGGRAPSKYLPTIEKASDVCPERMDEILRSHCIEPGELRADQFWQFCAARAEALLQRIEAATGKTIARQPELFRAGFVAETYEERAEEWDVEEPLEEAAS